MTSLRAAIFVLLSVSACRAFDVVSIEAPGDASTVTAQVGPASHVYGLQVKSVFVEGPEDSGQVIQALRQPDTLAAVIAEGVLPYLDQAKVFSALRRSGGNNVPLLIMNVGKQSNSLLLAKWSGGEVLGCRAASREWRTWKLAIEDQRDIAYQLAGVTLPFLGEVACGLEFQKKVLGARPLVQVSDQAQYLATFVESVVHGQHVFFLAQLVPSESASYPKAQRVVGTFSAIAPLMMFLRNSAGDRAWHTIGHYANLTVDDAWLTEPYGNLNYEALLEEMERHNFHTTIAFIPWNFDRSQPDVVSLFRKHPERFSICVHGNNHAHREFGDYADEPLTNQTISVKQALARMEEFTNLTQIPHDRVMVFPHCVAPVKTFGILKKYNYWATINSENAPLGSHPPDDPLFALRFETLEFANFLTIFRCSAQGELPPVDLAVNAYLGNPLLFYVHEGYFNRGICAFNQVADTVNRVEPDVKWASLGSLTQHLYLVRSRRDQDSDVRAYSPDFYLTNSGKHRVVFHVRKPENFIPGIALIKVDGDPQPYRNLKWDISLDFSLEPGQSRNVEVLYQNDLNLGRIDIAKTNFRVNLLRRISDIRDLKLSRSNLGRDVADFYYRHHLDEVERHIEPWTPFLLLLP